MTRDIEGMFDGKTKLPSEEIVLAGRYRIVRELGRGAQGSVYLAEDLTLGNRQVAIKMPPAVLARNKKALTTLRAEAEMAMRLSHPNIVTLRTFESTDEGVFLVMDYVDGLTLEDILADERVLPASRVYEMFTPLAKALDHAHGEKVVHRDVKPSNILIRAADGKPMLTDFGIAREVRDTMTRVTRKGTSGTLPYMSPEQLRGAAPSPEQDIYGLAATMYECLAGRPPFFRGEIAHQIETVEPDPLPQDSPFSRRIMRGLAKDVADRPATCRALLDAETPPDTPPRRSAVPWIVAVAAALGLAVVLAIVLGGGNRQEPARPSAADRTPMVDREPERADPPVAARDTVPPEIRWIEPIEGLVTGSDRVWVSAYVTDDHPPETVSVRVNGGVPEDARLESDLKFRTLVALRAGRNEIEVSARDGSGNRDGWTRVVDVDKTPPRLEIPPDLDGTWSATPRLTFIVCLDDEHPKSVTCDSRAARDLGGGRFECAVTLPREGPNPIELAGMDGAGLPAPPRTITLHLDSKDPELRLDPVEARTTADRVTISGEVGEPGCAVSVAGAPARVVGQRFEGTVDLREGPNPIEIVARDRVKRSSSKRVTIVREAASALPRDPPNAAPYTPETRGRFEAMTGTATWGKPSWNSSGTLETVHAKTGLTFVLIPGTGAGGFMMGSPGGEAGRDDDEKQHRVTVAAFLLSKTECTQASWVGAGGTNGSRSKGESLPVEQVSWSESRAWCLGQGLRLPSESEWEYACRSTTTTAYTWGDEWDPSKCMAENDVGSNEDKGVGWYRANGFAVDQTAPVGRFPANRWGLHDMPGNVWEWCEDEYESYDRTPKDGSAYVAGGSGSRVRRGGSWRYAASYCRSANRNGDSPGLSNWQPGLPPRREGHWQLIPRAIGPSTEPTARQAKRQAGGGRDRRMLAESGASHVTSLAKKR